MSVEINTDITWVKNGDPISGVFSMADFIDGSPTPDSYDYGVNLPYYQLSKNDKILSDAYVEFFDSFDVSEQENNRVPNNSVVCFQFVPNILRNVESPKYNATDLGALLFPWKINYADSTNYSYGISYNDFYAVCNDSSPTACKTPGLDFRTESVTIGSKFSIGTTVMVTVTPTVRSFGTSPGNTANSYLSVSVGNKSYIAPISFKCPSVAYVHGTNICEPIMGGVYGPTVINFLHKIVSSSDRLSFTIAGGGSVAKYATFSCIDVEVRALVKNFS